MYVNKAFGGRALRIAVGITILALLLGNVAAAEDSYEFMLKIPSSQQWYFSSPSGVAVDTNGYIYVAGVDIQKFNSSGSFLAKWGSPGSIHGEK